MKNLPFFIGLLIFFAFGCSDEYYYNLPNSVKKTIVVIGSSTAAGAGLKKGESWVDLLSSAEKDHYNIVNLAKGGISTYEAMPSAFYKVNRPLPDTTLNINKALIYKPFLIIINIPTNDIARNYSDQEYLDNLDSLYKECKHNKIRILLTTTQPRNLTLSAKDSLIKAKNIISKKYTCNTIDFWTQFANADGSIKSYYDQGDGTHLNQKAHVILFQRVDSILKKIK
jgi:acyl-CoA thioesterase I